MSSTLSCAGCNKHITNLKELMRCGACKQAYDLACVNITPKRFLTLTKDFKSNWLCPQCQCTAPKTGNSNTPIRSTIQNAQEEPFVTTRNSKKPRRKSSEDITSDVNLPSDALRTLIREELSITLKATISELVSNQLRDIKDQMTKFEEALHFFNNAYEEMKTSLEAKSQIIDTLKKENAVLNANVSEIGNRLNLVEQCLREQNIEINGVPEDKAENITTMVAQLAETVNCPLLPNDIIQTFRVAKQTKLGNRPRAIVVKLRNRGLRDNLISATIKFNKLQNPKLNTQHLGYGGTSSPVYISEHLSPANKYLHAMARKKAKEIGYKFIWVKDGRIFVRKDENCAALHIRTLDNIQQLV